MNLNPDGTLEKINSTEKRIIKNRSCALLSTHSKDNTQNCFVNMKEQCHIISFFVNLIPPTHLVQSQKMTSALPDYIQSFANLFNKTTMLACPFEMNLIEISSSGFTGSTKLFEQFLRSKYFDAKRIIQKIQEDALTASYFIYSRQNKTWSEPELILFTQFFFCLCLFFLFFLSF